MKIVSKKKVALITTTVLVLSLIFTSVVFADNLFKNLKAWYGDIKIFSNNQQVQMDVKPFIVDGTTYVPLRALSNILNKNVGWDQANLRIDITDKPDPNAANMAYLSSQLVEKQTKINELEAKVKQLEDELAKASKYSLDDMENYLNKEYGKYEKIEFDIDLRGDEDDIEVRIYVDLDDYYNKWYSLSSSKIESFIEYIVDDILDEFKNADVEGFIEDSSIDDELVDFYFNARKKLVVDIKDDSYSGDLEDLEDYLNDNHYRYNGIYFEIQLTGDEDDIRVYITADDDDLDYLKSSQIKDYLEILYDEITYDFPYAEIDGYIEDDYTEYYFDFDSKGNAYLYD